MPIRNEPMFAAPAAYRVKGRVHCDECVNVLHEANGVGEPPRKATVARNVTGHPDRRLVLCSGHSQLWKRRDGIGEKPKRAVRGRR